MSHEVTPGTARSENPQEVSLYTRSLNALRQHREAAAIALTATALAAIVSSSNPSPANSESQKGYVSTTDNNLPAIVWSQDLKNLDPGRVAIGIGFWTVLIAIGASELIKDERK